MTQSPCKPKFTKQLFLPVAAAAAVLLVGSAVIVFGGAGSDRTDRQTPAASAAGEATAPAPHHHGVHSCSLTMPMGLAACIDQSPVVVAGSVVKRYPAGDGVSYAEIEVSETLLQAMAGSAGRGETDAAKSGAAGRIAVLTGDDEGTYDQLGDGEQLLLCLRALGAAEGPEGRAVSPDGVQVFVPVAYLSGVIHLDEDVCAGVLPLARVLAATAPTRAEPGTFAVRAAALTEAISTGGRITRYRAALDLTHAQALVTALTAGHVRALVAALDAADGLDPVCRELMVVLSSRGDATLTDALCRVLGKARANKLFDELARVLAQPSLREAATYSLQPHLAANRDPQTRRFAAFALARLGSECESAKPVLRGLLDDADRDVASEALIGLAGSGDEALRDRAYGTLRAIMAEDSVVDDTSPIATAVRSHEFQQARHALHTGPQLAQLAAGYFLARSPVENDRNWLAGRASRIPDFAVRAFVRDRLTNIWADFDTPW